MNRPEITIAIPAYNEVECLESVVRRAQDTMSDIGTSFEVLVVDDGSTDGTGTLADRLAQQFPEVRVVHHDENLGFTGAIATCYRSAQGEWLFLIPADGQVDVADIRRFLPMRDGADVVLGYRLVKPDAWYRRLNSLCFHALTSLLFGFRFREISTTKLYRVDLLREIRIVSRRGTATIEPEVIYRLVRLGARFAEVGYPFHPRQGGVAKGARPAMIFRTFFALLELRVLLWKEGI